jgi:peptide/nickel transport system substrate-binding protein
MRSTFVRMAGVLSVGAASLALAACGGGSSGDSSTSSSNDSGSGSTAAAKTGGTANFDYAAFPDFLDPALSYTVEGWQALDGVYTRLLAYKKANGEQGAELQPGLAEAMPEITNGGKTYTFTLRAGLKYSDGTPVKASDFEHQIKRVLNLESGGSSFYQQNIAGAAAYLKAGKKDGDISGITSDEATRKITINLNAPSGQFPFIVAMPFAALVPGDTPYENQTKDPPPGVGPFMIKNVKTGRSFSLVRNPNWKPLPGIPAAKLDQINITVTTSDTRAITDVLDNKADYFDNPPAGDTLREFRQKAPERFKPETTNSTYYFFLNQRVKPFDDPQVRQAVNYAIDKRALVRLFGGLMAPDCNFLPPGMEGYQKQDPCVYGDPTQAPNVAKAKQMIQAAGAAGKSVTVYGNDEDQTRGVTEYFANVLKDIGLNPQLRIINADVYFTTIGNQNTKAAAGFADWYQDYPHPDDFMFLVNGESIQQTNNQNYSNVDDKSVNSQLDALKKEDLSKAAAGYAAIDKKIVEQGDVVPYGHRQIPLITSNRIDFGNIIYGPVMQADYTTFALK